MKGTFFVILLFVFSLRVPVFSQVTNPVVFSADDTDSLITAEFEFSPLPEYNRASTLTIKLKAINSRLTEHALEKPDKIQRIPGVHLKDVTPGDLISVKDLELNLVAGPSRYTNFNDTIIIWKLPINAGDSMTLSFPVKFSGVGEFNVVVSEASRAKDMVNLREAVVIGEDGKLVYLGMAPAPFSNPLGTHPYVFGDSIEDMLKGRGIMTRHAGLSLPEPFNIKLAIDPNLKVGQRSIANLSIAPMSDSVGQLQYEIIAATNLQIDSLSPSPDINPGVGNSLDVSFGIMPEKAGRSYLSFEIFGYKPGARYTDIINSTLKYYLIFGSDSTLLYVGSVDPFAVGFEPGNPAYKSIESIVDFAETGYGEKVYRSEPDFEYDRINQQRILDSIAASKLLDTIPEKDSIK